MNYLEEDTAFEAWCENNYLPIFAQAIWKKLFKRFNRSGWREWVTVDNLTLMADVQIKSEKSFIHYRDKLIEAGLVEYQKGKKGSPNQYKLVSFKKYTSLDTVHSTAETTVSSEVETTVKTTVHSTDLYKLKQNKDKKDIDKSISKKFTPPTLEEVFVYCQERNNNVDAERFINHYTAKGWFIGKNKMKDWKAAVRTWEAKVNNEQPICSLSQKAGQASDYSEYDQ